MKAALMLVMTILLLVHSESVQAEFYRYVDQHGNVIFTDDLNKIPVNQRTRIQTYEESLNPSKPEESVTKPGTLSKSDAGTAPQAARLESERRHLQEREKVLSQEYEALMAERTLLDDQKKEALTRDQIKSYNEKIVKFNTRLQAYEEKRDAYAADLKTFNERLEALQSEAQKKP